MSDDSSRLPAARLRDAREKAGYASAAEASRAHGWSPGAYRHHENGTRPNIPVKAAERYGAAYGVSTGWILGLTDDPSRSPVEELESILIGDKAVDPKLSFNDAVATKFGLVFVHHVLLSELSDPTGIALDSRNMMAFDLRLIQKSIPTAKNPAANLLAIEVDFPVSNAGVKAGAFLLVDRSAVAPRQQGTIVVYVYAGLVGIARAWQHPDQMIELIDLVGGGSSGRLAQADVAVWNEVVWIGQSPS